MVVAGLVSIVFGAITFAVYRSAEPQGRSESAVRGFGKVFNRDSAFAWVAALFLVAPWKAFGVYLGILLFQLIVVRHAAATYGVRFVCTVLAQKAGKPTVLSAAKKSPA